MTKFILDIIKKRILSSSNSVKKSITVTFSQKFHLQVIYEPCPISSNVINFIFNKQYYHASKTPCDDCKSLLSIASLPFPLCSFFNEQFQKLLSPYCSESSSNESIHPHQLLSSCWWTIPVNSLLDLVMSVHGIMVFKRGSCGTEARDELQVDESSKQPCTWDIIYTKFKSAQVVPSPVSSNSADGFACNLILLCYSR